MSNQSSEYDNKIVLGEVGEVLRDLPFLGIDCVVTSPPYFNLRQYTDDPREIGREETIDAYIHKLVRTFRQISEHMNVAGSLWVNLGDNFDKGMPKLVPWRFMFAMLEDGWLLRNIVIWYKVDAMSESTQRRFSQKYEPFFWFTRSEDYYFNYAAATIPCKISTVQRLENKFYHNKGHDVSRMAGMIGDQSHKIDQYLERGVNAGDIWPIMCNHEKVEHSAPFPVELVIRPIVATCPEKGLVFDPFMGSGTTALATSKMGEGRRYFGTDINPDSVLEANQRVADEVGQFKLF
jgi:DNA modification methylase